MAIHKYTHIPRQVVDTELTDKIELKKKSEKGDLSFLKLEEDGTFKREINHSLRREYEFNNKATFFYLCDAAKYLCTHKRKQLNLNTVNYIECRMSWDIFLKITIGKYPDQYPRMIYKLKDTLDRYRYIPKGDGGYYIMPPFRLVFETMSPEELTEGQLQKLKNIDVQRIGFVTFSMAKALFGEYLDGGQYYRHPVHLYATIYDIVSKWKINKNPGLIPNTHYDPNVDYNKLLTSPQFVAGYIRAIDFLYLKGASSHKEISIDETEFLPKVMPSLCYFDKRGKMYLRNGANYQNFMQAVVILTNMLDVLDYKLIGCPEDDPYNKRHSIFRFKHNTGIQG